jgi:hypothetical protein
MSVWRSGVRPATLDLVAVLDFSSKKNACRPRRRSRFLTAAAESAGGRKKKRIDGPTGWVYPTPLGNRGRERERRRGRYLGTTVEERERPARAFPVRQPSVPLCFLRTERNRDAFGSSRDAGMPMNASAPLSPSFRESFSSSSSFSDRRRLKARAGEKKPIDGTKQPNGWVYPTRLGNRGRERERRRGRYLGAIVEERKRPAPAFQVRQQSVPRPF